jgi:hypothetical protein
MLRHFALLALLIAIAGACGDSPGDITPLDPAGPPASLQVVAGNEQRGFSGEVLPSPLVAELLDASGRGVPGKPLNFQVIGGDGSLSANTVLTNASGRAEVQWTLGSTPGVPQRVDAHLAENPPLAPITFTAVAEAAPTNLRFQTVYAGGGHSCGLTSDGRAFCWGLLGNDGSMSLVPTAVPGGPTFRAIAAGFDHSCALTPAGDAYCWGSNESFGEGAGQLGDGSGITRLVPTRVVGGFSFKLLALGWSFSCGVELNGAAYCWGRVGNRMGISLEPTPVPGDLDFSTLSAGAGHVCGLVALGEAYCWGDNFSQELGAGSEALASASPLPVQGGLTFRAIAAGGWHTCGLTMEHGLACWGWDDDSDYSPGFNNGVSIHSDAPVPVPGSHTFGALSEGWFHGCGLATDGAAYCWFENGNGELGNGTQVGSYAPVPVR